jgi:phage shock protein PspC (stress-responsive transcriptional regulator)
VLGPAHTGGVTNHRTKDEEVSQYMRQQGLIRPREGRVIGGVCAGLGRRFGFSPWQARILFVVILMLIPGSQIIIYPILWILMPSEQPAAGSYPGAATG